LFIIAKVLLVELEELFPTGDTVKRFVEAYG
jgi:hypothetical protein